MSSDKNELWDQLGKHKFQINAQLSIDMQCIICDGDVGNAPKPCGCFYCSKSKRLMSEDGFQNCLRDSHYCTLDKLVFDININIDNSENGKVSKLQIKCPSNSCEFKGELIDMCDHLKICNKISMFCPYSEIGCPMMGLKNDETSDHIQTNVYMHGRLLIEELLMNKMDDVSCFAAKAQQMMKVKGSEMLKETESKIIPTSDKGKHDSNDNHKDENDLNSSLLKENNYYKWNGDSINWSPLKRPSEDSIDSQMLIDEISRDFKTSLSLEKKNRIASFKWQISEINRLREHSRGVESVYFYSKNNEYKMKLWMDPNSSGDGTWLKVDIFIWNGNSSKPGRWPFIGVVTITIKNKLQRAARLTASREMTIDKPNNISDSGHSFYFSVSSMEQAKIFQNKSISIECFVFTDKGK